MSEASIRLGLNRQIESRGEKVVVRTMKQKKKKIVAHHSSRPLEENNGARDVIPTPYATLMVTTQSQCVQDQRVAEDLWELYLMTWRSIVGKVGH